MSPLQSILKIPLFDGNSANFLQWVDRLSNVFVAGQLKGLLKPITEESWKLKDPGETYEEYVELKEAAAALIINALDSESFELCKKLCEPLDVIAVLKKKHLKSDRVTKINIVSQLIQLQIEDSSKPKAHFDTIRQLRREASTHGLNNSSFTFDDLITTLSLRSLGPSFALIVGIIENLDEKLTMDQIEDRVLAFHERTKTNATQEAFFTSHSTSYQSQNQTAPQSISKVKAFCQKCSSTHFGACAVKCLKCGRSHYGPVCIPLCRICSKYHNGVCRQASVNAAVQSESEEDAEVFFNKGKSQNWYLDSGASIHVTGNASLLFNLTPSSIQISVANAQSMAASSVGEARIILESDERITLTGVVYAPTASNSIG